MRIVHVIHAFPPSSRAGSENYVEALAREQAGSHEIFIFHRVADPERPEYELTTSGDDVYTVTHINRTFGDLNSFRETYHSEPVASAFATFLDRTNPQIAHFHHVTGLSTTCVLEAKRRGIPVVFTLHDFWLLCPRGQLLRRDLSLCSTHDDDDCVRCMKPQLRRRLPGPPPRLLRRVTAAVRSRVPTPLIARLTAMAFAGDPSARAQIQERTQHVRETCGEVDRFISPSQFLKERFVGFGIPSERIEVMGHGFDLSAWKSPTSTRARENGVLRAVFLGTWIPSKGVHVLVEAFRKLDPSRHVLDIHGYAVAYDGFEDYEQHLRRLAGDAPHIRFHGSYEPRDVPGILASADVLVAPSIWFENAPLTVREAFLAGVPVVASAHGGLAESVRHEVDGLTFTPGDARALGQALERLAADPELMSRLRRGLPKTKSITEHARELDALYATL